MTSLDIPVSLSTIDEERFGIKSAKAQDFGMEHFANILKFCEDNGVVFLIARCQSKELHLIQEMERNGFLFMDTLVHYSCNLKKNPPPALNTGIVIRSFRPGEEKLISSVAEKSFTGYHGHYHADSRLDPAKCNEAYMDWARKSCLAGKAADDVLIAEVDGNIAGFATMRARDKHEGEGILFGVEPSYQGRGIYYILMVGGMRWCLERGLSSVSVSTQIINIAVQKVWVRLGFEPTHAIYTFHKWFDQPRKEPVKKQ
jgi:GNAT superfamily N-acetyltransferase